MRNSSLMSFRIDFVSWPLSPEAFWSFLKFSASLKKTFSLPIAVTERKCQVLYVGRVLKSKRKKNKKWISSFTLIGSTGWRPWSTSWPAGQLTFSTRPHLPTFRRVRRKTGSELQEIAGHPTCRVGALVLLRISMNGYALTFGTPAQGWVKSFFFGSRSRSQNPHVQKGFGRLRSLFTGIAIPILMRSFSK